MKTLSAEIEQFLQAIGSVDTSSSLSSLQEVARLTALRLEPGHGYFVSNFWRGALLYGLIELLRPSNVLELGTGRGYGAFSMATAALDHDLPIRIWSVDAVPTDARFNWHYDAGDGPRTDSFSKSLFWDKFIAPEIRNFVTPVTGDTASITRSWKKQGQPPVDLIFIDADHSYVGVKRDFLAALRACTPDAIFVFDDYSDREGYGVKKLLDSYIPHHAPDSKVTVIKLPKENDYDVENDHQMAVWQPRGGAVPARFDTLLVPNLLLLDAQVNLRKMALKLKNRLISLRGTT